MIVKTERAYWSLSIVLAICTILASMLLYRESNSVLVPAIVYLPGGLLCLLQWVAAGKTLIFSENGITISFLWYAKKYRWEDLKTKRYVNYKNKLGYRNPCLGGAEFSPKRVKHLRHKSADYCTLLHPCSFFYVSFKPKSKSQYPVSYAVNETKFRNQLSQWGIELETEGEPLL